MRHRMPNVVRALRDVPPDAPVIVLSHDPDLFPRMPERVALTLSGHTHGGQVAIPLLRRPLLPSYYGERYARGHIVEHDRHLLRDERRRHERPADPLPRAARGAPPHPAPLRNLELRVTYG